MAFVDQVALVNNAEFRDRVRLAVVTAALQISGGPSSGDPDYDSRAEGLAYSALNAPEQIGDRFVWAVAANPAITLNASDNDIQFTVNSVWGDVSGASLVQ